MNTDAATLTAEGHDFWGFGGTPGLVLRPCTREEVLAVVRIAAEHHTPLGHTGRSVELRGDHAEPAARISRFGTISTAIFKILINTQRDQCRKDITRKEWRCDRLSGPQAP